MSNAPRILVCDDSLTIRRLVAIVTANLGMQLDMATTAAEGVDKAQSSKPDLILLDYVLPDAKGGDVLDRLAQSEHTRSIPVVMMSAKGEELVATLGEREAVVGFLHKPFKPQELERLLRERRPAAKPAPAPRTPPAAEESAPPKLQPEATLSRLDDTSFARLLFKVLRGELAKLAEAIAAGAKPDPSDLGRRLIKPTVIRDLRAEIEAVCPNRRRMSTGLFEAIRPLVPERVPGFSSKIAGLPLRDHERSVLALVDGVRTVEAIEREMPPAEACAALDTAAHLGLVRMRSGLVGGARPGTLWLIDDLPNEFAADLAAYLARSGRRWSLVRMRHAEAVDEVQRAVPDGILVQTLTPETIAALRAIPALERTPVAAIHDETIVSSGALLGAGADMALSLPVKTSAIDSFLGLSIVTADSPNQPDRLETKKP